MTTPHQGAPDGAVTIGGNAWNFGQLVSEEQGRAQFEIEAPSNLFEALELLPVVLGQLPSDSMKPWQKWLNLTDEDRFNGTVKDRIIESLSDNPLLTAIKNLVDVAGQLQFFHAKRDKESSKGWTFPVNFSDFGSVTAAGFSVFYSGAGASAIVVDDGVAQWDVVDNLDRDAMLVYSEQTATDFQTVRGVMHTPPQKPDGDTPYFYAVARVSPDRQNYVWARARCVNFGSYKADFGYCVAGVEHTWATDIDLSWSLDMRFVAGVGTNVREFQVWSGNKLVHSFTESGTASKLCDAGHTVPADHTTSCVKYRGWGAIAQVRNGKIGGKVASCSASDCGTPPIVGSAAQMVRTSTSLAAFTGGSAITALNGSFFDGSPYESVDIDAKPSDGTFTVAESKSYIVTARINVAASVITLASLILQRSTDGGSTWQSVQYGPDIQCADGSSLFATWIQPLNANDKIRLAYVRDGITVNQLTGDADGAKTYFSITGVEPPA